LLIGSSKVLEWKYCEYEVLVRRPEQVRPDGPDGRDPKYGEGPDHPGAKEAANAKRADRLAFQIWRERLLFNLYDVFAVVDVLSLIGKLTALAPGIDFRFECIDCALLLMKVAAHWKFLHLLPALHGADITLEISGDFFPGIETAQGNRSLV
jgi:hypothetical protein